MALFDCDPQLIRTLSKEQKVGKRDIVIKPKSIGPNDVTYVGAKSMRGIDFVKKLEEKITKLTMDFDMEEEEDEDEEAEELEEEEDEEELDEEDEDDLEEEDLEEDDEDEDLG